MTVSFFVPGIPRPQGSKRHVGNGRMIESSKYLKAWRQTVTIHAVAHRLPEAIAGPVWVALTFVLPRPTSHYGTGANATRVRPTAPQRPTARPDLSKLIRAVEDSLTDARVWADDSQVVRLESAKRYATRDEPAGVHIWIKEVS